jgi:hypothetical protein
MTLVTWIDSYAEMKEVKIQIKSITDWSPLFFAIKIILIQKV